MRIIKATEAELDNGEKMENALVTSMSEDDLRWFIAHPDIMFCSDGELHGSHPRGAGPFPRPLGRYVREEKLLPLEAVIHNMSGEWVVRDGKVTGHRPGRVLRSPAYRP